MAGRQRGAGGEHVVDQQDVPRRRDVSSSYRKGVGYVRGPGGLVREPRLAAGAAPAFQEAFRAGSPQAPRHLAGDECRLIVAAPPAPRPVQGHRHHQVHVRVERGSGEPAAQQAGEIPPRAEVAVVFQGLRDLLVSRLRPIMEKSRNV